MAARSKSTSKRSFSKSTGQRAFFNEYYCQDDEIDVAIEWSRRQRKLPSSLICVVAYSLENFQYSNRLKSSPNDFHLVTFDELLSTDSRTLDVVVALWPTREMLFQLEAYARSSAIVAVTWFKTEIADWAENQSAINLYDSDWWKIDGAVPSAQATRIEMMERDSLPLDKGIQNYDSFYDGLDGND